MRSRPQRPPGTAAYRFSAAGNKTAVGLARIVKQLTQRAPRSRLQRVVFTTLSRLTTPLLHRDVPLEVLTLEHHFELCLEEVDAAGCVVTV
jgi:hypothetical protein